MSEPITLWNADGQRVVLYSPSEAVRLVQAGELHGEPPVPPNGDMRLRAKEEAARMAENVPMSKRVGRPRKGDGVL